MSDEVRDRFEIPNEMRSMAEAGLGQARKTFEKFLSGAEATAGTIPYMSNREVEVTP